VSPPPPALPPSLPPDHITGPLTVQLAGTTVTTSFTEADGWSRQNGGFGDFARWCVQGSDCRDCATPLTLVSNVNGVPRGDFSYERAGLFHLCYMFVRRDYDSVYQSTPLLQEFDVAIVVVDVAHLTPHGTAIGCSSQVRILPALGSPARFRPSHHMLHR
jgi:hypothetical protein